jgi:hypothetical protein
MVRKRRNAIYGHLEHPPPRHEKYPSPPFKQFFSNPSLILKYIFESIPCFDNPPSFLKIIFCDVQFNRPNLLHESRRK